MGDYNDKGLFQCECDVLQRLEIISEGRVLYRETGKSVFSEDEGKCKNTAVGKLLEITHNNVDCYGAKIIIRICQFFFHQNLVKLILVQT